jgi:NAD(P)-dependent dehydrogenase (short-subunit alcohol dehydrogenase family)
LDTQFQVTAEACSTKSRRRTAGSIRSGEEHWRAIEMRGLQGKVALVTGASSGIGKAASLAFAREGARVVLAGRRQKESEETVEAIRKSGGEAVSFKADVCRASEIEALVQFVIAQYGHLDCAFNNAGIASPLAATAQCTEQDWDETINTNLKGVWLCMRYQIPAMLANSGGAIVNNASAAGVVGLPMQAAYSASKGGVIQLTRTAALEYARSGIRVNAVCPGPIRTPMAASVLAQMGITDSQTETQIWDRLIPMSRPGTAEEVAAAAVWLCSDAASFVTGQAMLLDGGLTAQ